GYSNWELSTERANAARRELILGGMNSDKVLEVVGLGEAVPLNKQNPTNPENRRISIVVMKSRTEKSITDERGRQENAQDILHPEKGPNPDPGAGQENASPDAAHEGADAGAHQFDKPDEDRGNAKRQP
ncbi:MAG: OmpA family protein, partial [Candidatus Methylumidiphilus sp.]